MKRPMIPNHLIVAASSWLARLVTASVQIVAIGVLMRSIGGDGYAAFALLSGLAAWVLLFDFGVGHSLQNYISESKAVNKGYETHILAGFVVALLFIIVVMVMVFLFSDLVANSYLKSFCEEIVGDKSATFYSVVCILSMTTFGTLLFKIWFAEHKGWLANVVLASSSLLGLLLMYIGCDQFEITDLTLVFLLFYGPTAAISCLCLLWRIHRLIGTLGIPNSITVLTVGKSIVRRGKSFWLFSFVATIVLQADYIVMSQKFKPEEIVDYIVLMKIFSFVSFFHSALLQAIWPLCVELRVKKSWPELNRMVSKYISLGFFLVLTFSILLWSLKSDIVPIISSGTMDDVDGMMYFLMTLYFLLRVWSDTYAMLHQSMNYVSPLWKLVPLQAIISFSFQWYLSDYLGVYGLLLGLILSFLFTACFILPLTYRNRIQEYMRA